MPWYINGTLEDGTGLSGGVSHVSKWGTPIYVGGSKKECGICRNEPMIRPVQIQCRHVICNPCIQNLMSLSDQKSYCPVCRSQIFEYRSLESHRIRRPRDKSVPFEEGAPDGPPDSDYTPSQELTAGGYESQPESSSSDSESDGEETESEMSSSTTSTSSSSTRHSLAHDDLQTQESVVILEESKRSDDVENQRDVIQLSGSQQGEESQHVSAYQQNEINEDQLEIVYETIQSVEAHRGRGKSIRYLVLWPNGETVWEPLVHMSRCPQELSLYRKRLHVINQQNYRKRKAKGG